MLSTLLQVIMLSKPVNTATAESVILFGLFDGLDRCT